jgi:hypothetical protein
MDYYVCTEADKNAIAYNRCFADAENGRVWLALLRLDDLREQFPNDAHINYAEALIRLDYLGEGTKAQELCWGAFQSNPQLKEALFNSVRYAPDRKTFHARISEAQRKFPNEPGIQGLYSLERSNHAENEPYWKFLYSTLGPEHEKKAGECAAVLELILKVGEDEIPPNEYAKFLRYRGESLRKLDRNAENRLQFFGERFLPENRLSLQQAFTEFEQYIDDPYFRNPETLNLCGVYAMLLNKYDQALKYANEAISTGGKGYINPHRNKALILWGMGLNEESLALDEETLKKAEQAGDKVQVDEIKMVLAAHRKKEPSNITEFRPTLEVVFNGAGDAAFQEITSGKSTIEGISAPFLQRIKMIGWNWSVAYVPIMAEMFAFFSPEATYFIVEHSINDIPPIHQKGFIENIHIALRFLASYGTGVIKRDAVRLTTLIILNPLHSHNSFDTKTIKSAYRQSIRNFSMAAEGPPILELSNQVIKEMSRISLSLPVWMEDQSYITPEEIENTRLLISEQILLTERQLSLKKYWRNGTDPNKSKISGFVFILILFGISLLIWYFFQA